MDGHKQKWIIRTVHFCISLPSTFGRCGPSSLVHAIYFRLDFCAALKARSKCRTFLSNILQVLLIAGTVSAQCPLGEYYTFTGNACAERKCCGAGVACAVQTDCPPKVDIRCECSPGYYRDANTGRCVLEALCTHPLQCGPNELWNTCGSSCREVECSRSSVGPVQKSHNTCSTQCEQRCECMPGYIRRYDGTCVAAADCYRIG